MKSLTHDQLAARKEQAVRFTRDVLGDPDRADEIAEESLEDYAERRKIALINSGRRNGMARLTRTKAELEQEVAELEEENQELQDQLDAIADIAGGADDEDDGGDDAGEEEETKTWTEWCPATWAALAEGSSSRNG